MKFNPIPIFLIAVGGYFLIRLRFFFILHPIRTLRRGLRAVREPRAKRSFTLALAGTLGVGNVFGVAFGIMVGGAGSLFWLLISMLFSMVIKYAEIVISSDNLYFDSDSHGGFFYVISASFRRFGRSLGRLYSLSTLALSLVLGAALQSNAVVSSVSPSSSAVASYLPPLIVLVTFVSIIGGARIIEKITVITIPLTTIIYIIITLSVIVINIDSLPDAINSVFLSAFRAQSVLGGAVAYLFSSAVREGFARGLLSNEAGAGTSSMAHARSGVISPSSAGVLGIFEVWFDTGLICLLTGVSILTAAPDPTIFENGMQLVSYSVGSALGRVGRIALSACVISFAHATVICWYYYGAESLSTLLGRRGRALYLIVFLLSLYLGCYLCSSDLVFFTDLFMAVATILTLSALIKNSDRVVSLSESGGVIDSESIRLRPFRLKEGVFSKAGKRR